jgi:hypothetical protein
MRTDNGWSDVVVHDVSRRGIGISANEPVTPGSYVEIRRSSYRIVARIIWASDRRVGARSQDPIDIDSLVAVTAEAGHGADGTGARSKHPPSAMPERRTTERSLAERAERSRGLSARLQFMALAALCGIAAFLIATKVNRLLAAPFERIRTSLSDHT